MSHNSKRSPSKEKTPRWKRASRILPLEIRTWRPRMSSHNSSAITMTIATMMMILITKWKIRRKVNRKRIPLTTQMTVMSTSQLTKTKKWMNEWVIEYIFISKYLFMIVFSTATAVNGNQSVQVNTLQSLSDFIISFSCWTFWNLSEGMYVKFYMLL